MGGEPLLLGSLLRAGMKPRRVICVAGMPGCGKEEFLKVAEEKGLLVVRMGDVVREEARRRGLEITDANVGGLANEERKRHGYGVWAERTLPHIRGELALVDGVRGRDEITVFHREFGGRLVVLAVHASPATRYQRILGRKRADDVVSREEFEQRDRRELSWGLSDVIALADVMVVNDRDIDEFRREARRILADLVG